MLRKLVYAYCKPHVSVNYPFTSQAYLDGFCGVPGVASVTLVLIAKGHFAYLAAAGLNFVAI